MQFNYGDKDKKQEKDKDVWDPPTPKLDLGKPVKAWPVRRPI